MSTPLGLFYIDILRKHVCCMFIFTFVELFFKSNFARSPIEYEPFPNISFLSVEGILTSTTTSSQSGVGSNFNKEKLRPLHIFRIGASSPNAVYLSIQNPLFGEEMYYLSAGDTVSVLYMASVLSADNQPGSKDKVSG